MFAAITWVAASLASVPCLLFLRNLRLYRVPPRASECPARGSVSVLIPARDEERAIRSAVEAALSQAGVCVEVLVGDDGSRDRTPDIVLEMAAGDPRLQLITVPPLPEGWCGKQHACSVLASSARSPVLVFVDADVRLAPDACARLVAFLESSGASLASGAPRQEVGTALERLVIPLIHFVLLGFLPIGRMRASTHPAYGAACGQLIVVRRSDYEHCGGHAAIRGSVHDGLSLPRRFRELGHRTDLLDATPIATCRMYTSSGEVWRGFAKNAGQGLGSPGLIVPSTLLLLGGQVAPFAFLGVLAVSGGSWTAWGGALAGIAASLLPRLLAARRFGQSVGDALLHPLGITCLVSIQWYALLRGWLGRPERWKGRALEPSGKALRDLH